MGRDLRGIAEWLLEPSTGEAPLGVGLLGWLVLFNGIRIIVRGSSGETVPGMWPAIAVGGCLVTLAVVIVTGRPIGLASGVLAWSFHITLGFFGVLESGTVEDDVDLLLGIVAATTLWVTGLWILYRNADFFLAADPSDAEPAG
ncbi:hypothetical protein [Natrinema salsiterrestre]|uniref:Uncharacterized protein n=1 Tax=Natrinema salsiterrestre TaxID=2950540 RepID=A0A9Q4Q4F7_9EURY|nr:hypothetical protein [Natrinema salsiterrestre]MDF9747347.1 hypothetical protein [Natrinema salsiterrestre]